MRRVVLSVLGAATLCLPTVSWAGPPVYGPNGFLCWFVSGRNQLAEAGTQTGEIGGGPFELINEHTGAVESGTLTCTIQVNSAIHNGTSNDAARASGHGTGFVSLAPTVVSFQADEDDLVYLCTQITYDNGPTVYLHSSDDPTVEGHWSTDPNSTCAWATSTDLGANATCGVRGGQWLQWR